MKFFVFFTLALALATTSSFAKSSVAAKSAKPTASKLIKKDLVTGTGDVAKAGKVVTVHYTGKLMDGKIFDSSVNRGKPFSFKLGENQVIEGWEKGVEGMKVGGKRKLTIPPAMAYKEMGAPPVIPPNATLDFEIELLGVN